MVTDPDVTVVLPVHNTMPYLSACLASVVGQSIGRDRMEVIAVDDGSTDGSGKKVDAFARRYPGTVRVIHQPNSGGPAGPCNRALEQATGRYVFFLGADDYLGTEALERLVAAADRWESDVVLGRSVGVNNRYLHQEVYARTAPEIDLVESGLVWSLSNTKLFRRALVEGSGLRFREDMPVCSDQPFTLEACLKARRISVLADYDYYHAVRRLDARNITYRSRHEARLDSARALTSAVAALVEPGKRRDAILVRHFSWEVGKLLGDDFRRLDRDVQERVRAGVADLVTRYLNDDIRSRLDVETRLRLSVAADGGLNDLLAMIRQDAEDGVPDTVVDAGRWYADYPGARTEEGAVPVEWSDVTDATPDWRAKVDAVSVAFGRSAAGARVLTVTTRSPLPGLADPAASASGRPSVELTAGDLTATTTYVGRPEGGTGTEVRAEFDLAELVSAAVPRGYRRVLRAQVTVDGFTGSAAVRAPHLAPVRVVRRRGARPYLVSLGRDGAGHLAIAITPVTVRRVVARLPRRAKGGT